METERAPPVLYPVVDVGDWPVLDDEAMGGKWKQWLLRPSAHPEETWLFKEVRQERSGRRRTLGDDWAEKVAAEIGAALGVPTAVIELAVQRGRRGVISRNVLPDRRRYGLVPGNELLQGRNPTYGQSHQGRGIGGYTLSAIFDALQSYGAPPGSPGAVTGAGDAFTGYLLLDALTGNTDRHDENWGVVRPPNDEEGWLAPAFDLASCLGYQASDEDKERRIREDDVGTWARRGRSRHVQGRPSLVDLACDALARVDERVADGWTGRLRALGPVVWEHVLDAVPDTLMSQLDRRFAAELLQVNRRRLLDGRSRDRARR